jgi:hypothetical protein
MAATLPCRGVVSDMLDPASHLQRLPAVSVPWCHDKGNPQSAHGISLRRTPVRQGDSLDPGFWQPARLFREFIQIALRPVPPAHMKCVALRLSVSHARTPGRSRAQSALGNFQGFPQIARDPVASRLWCWRLAGMPPAQQTGFPPHPACRTTGLPFMVATVTHTSCHLIPTCHACHEIHISFGSIYLNPSFAKAALPEFLP